MYGTLFALSLSLAWFVHRERVPGSRLRSKSLTTIGDFWMSQWNGVRAASRRLWQSTDRREWACGHNASHPWPQHESWFAAEHSALLLYGPAVLTGSSLLSGFCLISQMPPPVCLTIAS